MLRVSAEINQEDIKNLLKNFSGALVRKAVRSALDRTGTWGKNYLADDVSQNYNISTPKVKKAIAVKRTTQTFLGAYLIVRGMQLSLIDFGAFQDSVGVKVPFRKLEIYSYPHAFINRRTGVRTSHITKGKLIASSGGVGRFIAIRVGKTRYDTSGKPGRGPSIPMLVNRMSHREKRDNDLKNHLYQELEEQIAKRTLQQSAPIGTE